FDPELEPALPTAHGLGSDEEHALGGHSPDPPSTPGDIQIAMVDDHPPDRTGRLLDLFAQLWRYNARRIDFEQRSVCRQRLGAGVVRLLGREAFLGRCWRARLEIQQR